MNVIIAGMKDARADRLGDRLDRMRDFTVCGIASDMNEAVALTRFLEPELLVLGGCRNGMEEVLKMVADIPRPPMTLILPERSPARRNDAALPAISAVMSKEITHV